MPLLPFQSEMLTRRKLIEPTELEKPHIIRNSVGQYQVVKRYRPKGTIIGGQLRNPKIPLVRKQYCIKMSLELWDTILKSCQQNMSFNAYLVSLIEKSIIT